MTWSLRVRLSLMMFLEFAIPGAWGPFIYPYLTGAAAEGGLGFEPAAASLIFTMGGLAGIVAPFIGGQIVDRWFPTQWFLAVVHAAGGVLMLVMTQQKSYSLFLVAAALYSLAYAPTMALTASLAFHHMTDPDRQFGLIRVWGTVGWIVAGLALSSWRWLAERSRIATPADMLYLAAVFSFAMAVLCCFLPSTPPRKEAKNPWAFIEAVRLARVRPFAIFLVIAFVVGTQLQFYYILASDFLKRGVGIAAKNVPAVMTTAQLAEIVVMAGLLALALKKLGLRKTLAIGVIAWPLRYIVFASYQWVPVWVVVGALALHAFGYTFFFTAAQVYVNGVATADIRASAQALLALILGVAGMLGTLFTGWIVGVFSRKEMIDGLETPVSQWQWIFLVPCFLTVACAAAFLLFFHDPRAEGGPAAAAAEAPPDEA